MHKLFSKKGQGMSLNVIIIAALALIVLVILVAIFTGKISVFDSKVSEEGNSELVKMRINYGQCRPTAADEVTFTSAYGSAESLNAKDQTRSDFMQVISQCKSVTDKGNCEASGCRWS